jgi:hypothetical protein
LIWFVQLFIQAQTLDIPQLAHIYFCTLWITVIFGGVASHGARCYGLGGVIGVSVASFGLMTVYVNDLEKIPLRTIWWILFTFALCANLGGAIWWFRNDRDFLAGMSMTAFMVGLVGAYLLLTT